MRLSSEMPAELGFLVSGKTHSTPFSAHAEDTRGSNPRRKSMLSIQKSFAESGSSPPTTVNISRWTV